jgi:D-glycero-alpha-D-manno-heptose-7-phosphate kinase
MIITRTPFRVSFVGGGSDIPEFYKQSPGAVLSTTIDKFMYISTHRFFYDGKIRLKYSQTETVDKVDEIKHPVIKEILKKFNVEGNVEVSSMADIPSGTGLGSSSTFTVGMLYNLYARYGKYVNKEVLAEDAADIEINKLGDPIGKQDHYAAAFGGLNVFRFNSSGEVNVEPIHLKKLTFDNLQNNLLMFYTGDQREASSILTEQKEKMQSPDKVENLKKMVGLVDDLRDSLYGDDLTRFGEILHKNWLLKKQLASKISNGNIDTLYNKGLESGAIGGKLLGAGGGGFLLFYCDQDKQDKLREAMKSVKELNFRFENKGCGLIHIGDEHSSS